MQRLGETKVLRDPIHDYIHIDLCVIWDLINTKEFQRLKRIKQLGGAFQVYHTAEHTRFGHSLGVYEIVKRMVEEIPDIENGLSEYDKVVALIAGLLHDIGHFPFSHAFEQIADVHHEQMTIDIIKGSSEINKVLNKYDKNLVDDVVSVIDKTHPNPILTQLISSQMDADRMDYLLRDAYFTGTKYGEYDIERIFRTIRIKDGKIAIKATGIHGVEDYIMARYHMYWQVYFHPVSRAFEAMLCLLFKRLKYVYQNNAEILKDIHVFDDVLNNKLNDIKAHFIFDEATCIYGFTQLSLCDDAILSDLASGILNRHLFKHYDYKNEKTYNEIKELLIKQGYNTDYYLLSDNAKQRPYVPYGSGIEVLMSNGKVLEISRASEIVQALSKAKEKNDPKIFCPKVIGYIKA